MSEEYPFKRIKYIQSQTDDPNTESVVFVNVIDYKIENDLIIDAPISTSRSYAIILPEGPGSTLCMVQAYMFMKLAEVYGEDL